MKKWLINKNISYLLLLFALPAMTGCSPVSEFFKTGLWWPYFLVIVIVVSVIRIVSQRRRRRR